MLLLEQNERFGGCTHSFTIGSKANECEFDTGLHYVSSEMAYESCRSGAIQKFITRGHQKFVDLGASGVHTFMFVDRSNSCLILVLFIERSLCVCMRDMLLFLKGSRRGSQEKKSRSRTWCDNVSCV